MSISREQIERPLAIQHPIEEVARQPRDEGREESVSALMTGVLASFQEALEDWGPLLPSIAVLGFIEEERSLIERHTVDRISQAASSAIRQDIVENRDFSEVTQEASLTSYIDPMSLPFCL